jgi:hypothetical protein
MKFFSPIRTTTAGSMIRRRFIIKKITTVVRLTTFFVTLFFLSSCITVVFEPSMGNSQKVSSSTSPELKSTANPDEDAKQ